MSNHICPDCKQPLLRSGFLMGRKAYTCGSKHRLSPLALPVTLMLRRGNGVTTWNSKRWLIVGNGGRSLMLMPSTLTNVMGTPTEEVGNA